RDSSKPPKESRLDSRSYISDFDAPVRERLVPPVDIDAGAQPVHPERVGRENLAHGLLALGLDDPEAAERPVGRDLAQRSRPEHALAHAVEELDVRGHLLGAHVGFGGVVRALHDVKHTLLLGLLRLCGYPGAATVEEFAMARIVGGIASSHTPTIGFALDTNKQQDPVWAPIFKGYEPVQQWLAEKQPDVLFLIYNDHVTSFFFDHYSHFALGIGDRYWVADEGGGPRKLPP